MEAIAGYVIESALMTVSDPELRPARRCSVVRMAAVSVRTTLMVARYRFHLELPPYWAAPVDCRGRRHVRVRRFPAQGGSARRGSPNCWPPYRAETFPRRRPNSSCHVRSTESILSGPIWRIKALRWRRVARLAPAGAAGVGRDRSWSEGDPGTRCRRAPGCLCSFRIRVQGVQ